MWANCREFNVKPSVTYYCALRFQIFVLFSKQCIEMRQTCNSFLYISTKWVTHLPTSSFYAIWTYSAGIHISLQSLWDRKSFPVLAAVKDSLCWLLWILVFILRCEGTDSHWNYEPLESRLSHYVVFYLLTHWTYNCVTKMTKINGCSSIQ
jgi:hypothetical protein